MNTGDWLSREQIDSVIDSLSAADLIAAMGDTDAPPAGTKLAGAAFDTAAARMGLTNGTPATTHVRLSDFAYLAEKIGGAVNVTGPLSEGSED